MKLQNDFSNERTRRKWKLGIIDNGVQLDIPTNDGRANLPVCPNFTVSQRSNAGGTMGIRTPEHRSARSGGSLGGAAAPPKLGGGVEGRPIIGSGRPTACHWRARHLLSLQ
jgi:hypothetical protein